MATTVEAECEVILHYSICLLALWITPLLHLPLRTIDYSITPLPLRTVDYSITPFASSHCGLLHYSIYHSSANELIYWHFKQENGSQKRESQKLRFLFSHAVEKKNIVITADMIEGYGKIGIDECYTTFDRTHNYTLVHIAGRGVRGTAMKAMMKQLEADYRIKLSEVYGYEILSSNSGKQSLKQHIGFVTLSNHQETGNPAFKEWIDPTRIGKNILKSAQVADGGRAKRAKTSEAGIDKRTSIEELATEQAFVALLKEKMQLQKEEMEMWGQYAAFKTAERVFKTAERDFKAAEAEKDVLGQHAIDILVERRRKDATMAEQDLLDYVAKAQSVRENARSAYVDWERFANTKQYVTVELVMQQLENSALKGMNGKYRGIFVCRAGKRAVAAYKKKYGRSPQKIKENGFEVAAYLLEDKDMVVQALYDEENNA